MQTVGGSQGASRPAAPGCLGGSDRQNSAGGKRSASVYESRTNMRHRMAGLPKGRSRRSFREKCCLLNPDGLPAGSVARSLRSEARARRGLGLGAESGLNFPAVCQLGEERIPSLGVEVAHLKMKAGFREGSHRHRPDCVGTCFISLE
ncbi:MAG: hypothetical protein RLZZ244_1533 [Verrucomicrobiota bacterium]